MEIVNVVVDMVIVLPAVVVVNGVSVVKPQNIVRIVKDAN